jgi:hypothetical protein
MTLFGVREVSAGGIEINSRVQPATLSLDESTELSVSVLWDGAADRFLFGWPEAPALDGLKIVGSKRSAHSWVDGGTEWSRQEFTWTLEPERVGSSRVGVAELTYWTANDTTRDGRRLTTYPFDVQVSAGERVSSVRWWAIGSLMLLFVGIMIVLYTRRSALISQQRSMAKPHVRATILARLDDLRQVRQRGDGGEFATAASSLMDDLVRSMDEPDQAVNSDENQRDAHTRGRSVYTYEHGAHVIEREVMTELVEELRQQRYAPGGTDPSSMGMIESVIRLLALRLNEDADDNN